MLKKILFVLVLSLFVSAPVVASIGWLGNADRTYQNGIITCYLGALAPNVSAYFCGWNIERGFVMDHSWLASSSEDMNLYYTGSPTYTFTAQGMLN